MIYRILSFIITLGLAAALTACIEDGFSSSPADQPVMSTDTLNLGTVITGQLTPTARMTVYNPANKSISIGTIALEGDGADRFRLNVDGLSGRSFSNVEIRGGDSIFVLVEAILDDTDSDQPVDVEASLRFTTMGVDRRVVVTAQGQDVHRLRGLVVTADTRLSAGRPYQVFDSLVVAPGATLTLDAGTRLLMHDGSYIRVRGRVETLGTPDQPVDITGDRTGNVVGDISFDIMSRQWQGMVVDRGGSATLTHTDLRNTWVGLIAHGTPAAAPPAPATEAGYDLDLLNCRLHNSAATVLAADYARIRAVGCEFAEGGDGLVALTGGEGLFDQCTFGNNYLFTAITGAALQLCHFGESTALPGAEGGYGSLWVTNSIFSGIGTQIAPGDLGGNDILLQRCLIDCEGTDDANFVDILWDTDPLYRTVRNDYLFDYRLQPDSPALTAADPSLRLRPDVPDAYGVTRRTALGAYEPSD